MSSSKAYIATTLFIVLGLTFFLTSKAWMPSDKEYRKQNYDTLFEFQDWEVRIQNAQYNQEEKTMTFTLLERTKKTGKKSPEFSLYSGQKSDTKTELSYEEQDTTDSLNIAYDDEIFYDYKQVYSYEVTVFDVPKDYWYISVNFMNVEIKESSSDNSDIFRSQSEAEAEEIVTEKLVQIDYRLAG